MLFIRKDTRSASIGRLIVLLLIATASTSLAACASWGDGDGGGGFAMGAPFWQPPAHISDNRPN
jgi:hypothetical protein